MGRVGNLKDWIVLRELDSGGQGTVAVVLKNVRPAETPVDRMIQALVGLTTPTITEEQRLLAKKDFALALERFVQGEHSLGALKRLVNPTSESRTRLQTEAVIYDLISSPHLLKVLDQNIEENWIVTEYQPNGTLQKCLPDFQGDAIRSLAAIQPLVSVLSTLHAKGFTHRDFKPGNIFIGRNQKFVLGDAGLAFYANDTGARLTVTYENVGTRDYMPAWAMSRRAEIKPNFDVFSVGKVLWAMIAGEPACALWYVRDAENDLTKRFPGKPEMLWVNDLLSKCVVEREEQMKIQDGAELLAAIDLTLRVIENKRMVPERAREGGSCRACGVGTYMRGFNGAFDQEFLAGLMTFMCLECGHVEFFTVNPPKK